MIRKNKLYERPRKAFEKHRIEEENLLAKKYGLKNKREIWKSLAKTDYIRKRAMALAKSSVDEQDIFFNKLRNIGLKISSIADVLDLKVEDLLERRLSTIVEKKRLANSIKHARQMIVHKKILINEKVVNSPSYIVHVFEENTIRVKEGKLKAEEKKDSYAKEETLTQ